MDEVYAHCLGTKTRPVVNKTITLRLEELACPVERAWLELESEVVEAFAPPAQEFRDRRAGIIRIQRLEQLQADLRPSHGNEVGPDGLSLHVFDRGAVEPQQRQEMFEPGRIGDRDGDVIQPGHIRLSVLANFGGGERKKEDHYCLCCTRYRLLIRYQQAIAVLSQVSKLGAPTKVPLA